MQYVLNFLEVVGVGFLVVVGLYVLLRLSESGILFLLGLVALVVACGTWAAMRQATPTWMIWVGAGGITGMLSATLMDDSIW